MRRVPLRDCQLVLGSSVEVPESAARYLRDVLRLEVGARVEVFDGKGAAFEAELTALEPCTLALLEAVDAREGESPCTITLYQAVPKQDRFEWVVEKATELGVARIVPLETARSVVRIPAAKQPKRLARWQKIADEAARQCGRGISPEVSPVATLGEAAKAAVHDQQFVLHPNGARALRSTLDATSLDIGVWIGPEGGFTDSELETLSSCENCTLGPRVLRSETAGVAVVTAIQLLTGGLD